MSTTSNYINHDDKDIKGMMDIIASHLSVYETNAHYIGYWFSILNKTGKLTNTSRNVCSVQFVSDFLSIRLLSTFPAIYTEFSLY